VARRTTHIDPEQIRVVLLDIEGTTTPIDFVYKTLFPYASHQVESFLREKWGQPEIASLVAELGDQRTRDVAQGSRPPEWPSDSATDSQIARCTEYVRWLIARDSKCTPLKLLQGKIWNEGFEAGELHGEVYPDVPRAFARWHGQGREICIYSSGSVLAQQLLFRNVATGDLTPHIAAFFDTLTGIKTAPESYTKIAASRGRDPRECLFLSDATKEVEAARQSGMHGLLCDRSVASGSAAAAPDAIRTFDEIFTG
jgi:enolase-phosphatase E1